MKLVCSQFLFTQSSPTQVRTVACLPHSPFRLHCFGLNYCNSREASRRAHSIKAICEEEQAVRQTEQEKKVRQTMIPELDFARIHPAK